MTPLQGSDPQQTDDEQHRKELVLWGAMVMSIVLHFVVTQMVPSKAALDNSSLVNIFLVIGISTVGASFVIKSRLNDQAAQPGQPQTQKRWTAFIVALALCESAPVFGVVVWFVAGSRMAYVLMAVGLGGIILHYPRRISTL